MEMCTQFYIPVSVAWEERAAHAPSEQVAG